MTTWRNITVSVPEPVYRRARKWAMYQNMSISAVVTRFLEHLDYRPAAGLAVTPVEAREIDAALAEGISIVKTAWFLRTAGTPAREEGKRHFRKVCETLGQAVDWGPDTPPKDPEDVKP